MRNVGFASIALLLVASCSGTPFEQLSDASGGDYGAGGGEGTVDPFRPSCPGEETTLQGKVLAPNAADPVPGASVFIPASVPELFPPEVKCEVCGTYGESVNLWFTTTKYDGSFVLGGVCPGADRRARAAFGGRTWIGPRTVRFSRWALGRRTHVLRPDRSQRPRRAGRHRRPSQALARGAADRRTRRSRS